MANVDGNIPLLIGANVELDKSSMSGVSSKMAKYAKEISNQFDAIVNYTQRRGKDITFDFLTESLNKAVASCGASMKQLSAVIADGTAKGLDPSKILSYHQQLAIVTEEFRKLSAMKQVGLTEETFGDPKRLELVAHAFEQIDKSMQGTYAQVAEMEQAFASLQARMERTSSSNPLDNITNSFLDSFTDPKSTGLGTLEEQAQRIKDVLFDLNATAFEGRTGARQYVQEIEDMYGGVVREMYGAERAKSIFQRLADDASRLTQGMWTARQELTETTNQVGQKLGAITPERISKIANFVEPFSNALQTFQHNIDALMTKVDSYTAKQKEAERLEIKRVQAAKQAQIAQQEAEAKANAEADAIIALAQRQEEAERQKAEATRRATEEYYAQREASREASREAASLLGGAVYQGTSDKIKSIATSADTLHGVFTRMHPAVSKVVSAIKKIGSIGASAFNTVRSGVSKLIGHFKNLKKSADHSLDGFGKKAKRITLQMVKAMIGVRGLYMLFRKLKSAFTESFKSMAEAVPEVNAVMTDFKSALNNVKMSLATAFQPILQVVLPVLTAFLNVISRLLVALGNFFAILTGQGYIYEWTAAQEGYADAIGNTGKAAKKAQRDLMGFDEINRLSDKDGGSGGGGGGAGGGAGGYKQVPVTDPDGAIANFIQKIKKAWKDSDFTDIGGMLQTQIVSGLNKLNTWLNGDGKTFGTKIGKSLATFLNGLFAPKVDPVSGKTFGELLGSTLSSAVNVGISSFGAFIKTFNFSNLGTTVGQAFSGFFNNLDWQGISTDLAGLFNGCVEALNSFNAAFDLSETATKVSSAINTLFTGTDGIDWANLSDTFGDMFNNMLYGANTLIGNVDFFGASSNLFGAINDFFNNGIDWVTLGELFATSFNAIFDIVGGASANFNLGNLGTNIGTAISTMITGIDWADAASSLSGVLVDIFNGATNLLTSTDFESVGRSLMTFLANVDWDGIISGLGSLLNGLGTGIIGFFKGALDYVKDNGGWKGVAEKAYEALKKGWNALDIKSLLIDAIEVTTLTLKGVGELLIHVGRLIVDDVKETAHEFAEELWSTTQERRTTTPEGAAMGALQDFWDNATGGALGALQGMGQSIIEKTGMKEALDEFNDYVYENVISAPAKTAFEWIASKYLELSGANEVIAAAVQKQQKDMAKSVQEHGHAIDGVTHSTKLLGDTTDTTNTSVTKTGAALSGGEGIAKGYMATIQIGSNNVIKAIGGIPTALSPIAEVMKTTSETSFKNLTTPFTGTADWIKGITETVDTNLAPMADNTKKTAEGSYANLTASFNGTDSWAQNKAKGINDKFSAIVSGIKTSATTANTNMETAFNKSDSWAQGRVKGILDKFATMPSAINKDATDSNTNMENAFSGSDKWSQDKVKSILDQFATMPNAINTDATDSYNNMTTAFNGTTDWATTTLGLITGQFDLLPTSMQTDADDAYMNMTTAFDGTFDWVSGVYDDITGAFDPFAEFMDMEGSDANDYFRKHFDDIPTWSSDTLDALKGGFDDGSAEGMKSWFDSVGTDAYSSMTSPFDAIRDFADSKYNALKLGFGFGTADSPVSIFTNEFNNAYSAISTIFGGMGGLAEKEWGNFKGGFSTVSTWFGTTFGDAWQQVQNVFSKGGSIFGGIDNAVTDSMKSMINRIVSGTNNVIASPFEALNNRLYKISQIQILPNIYPFAWLKSISIPQIPKLAQGGVIPPNREFLAVLGDQSRGTNVEAPLSTIQEAVAQVMSSNNAELMRGFMMVVEAINNKNLVIGDKEIGKANSRYTSRENIRRGYAT